MTRRTFGTTAAFLLAGALGAGCAESAAQESERPAPLPAPAAAREDPAPPAPPDAPHGTRPMDDATVRALAEEVARLREEIARLTAAQAAPPAAPADAPDEPAAAEPAAPPAPAEPEAPAAPTPRAEVVERVIEREVPVYVDREVPVYVEREVVVASAPVVQTIVYEEVVYRDVSCHQYVPWGHVHSIGCGHHYYGCSCHPWYYSCGGSGVAFHIASDDWYGWVGWGHPYSYYHFGYWHRDYDYDRWCGYRRDYYARHHHDGHVGDRKRAKRAYRQGYEDGFTTGNDTPGRPGTRDAAAANDTARVGGSRENAVRTDARTRGGSTEGRSVVRGEPERPGGEVPGAARTSTRSQVPVVGADRSSAVTTFRSTAERERARREAAVRSTTGEVGRASAPEIVRREGRASTTARSREDFRRRGATPQDSSSRSTRDTVQRRTVTVPSATTTRARERGDGGRRLATPDRSRSPSVPDRARSGGVPDRSRSIGIPDRSGSRRDAPQRVAPTRTSAPSRAAPSRVRSSSPRSTTRTRGDRSGRRGLGD